MRMVSCNLGKAPFENSCMLCHKHSSRYKNKAIPLLKDPKRMVQIMLKKDYSKWL